MSEENRLVPISASRLKVYRTCGKQYYFKYVLAKEDRPEQQKNIGALLGTALHKAIELRYREGANPTIVFQTTMQDTLNEWESQKYSVLGDQWFAKYIKDGKVMLREMQWDMFNPSDLELNFELPFPNKENPIAIMRGIIDLVDIQQGFIADHKSQKDLPLQDEMDNDPQFIIYAWAYREIYGMLPTKLYWNHLRKNRIIEVDVLTRFEEKLAYLIEDIKAMLDNKHYARKTLDSTCRRKCSFYELCYGATPLPEVEQE